MSPVGGKDLPYFQSLGNGYDRCIHEAEVEPIVFLEQLDGAGKIMRGEVFNEKFPVD